MTRPSFRNGLASLGQALIFTGAMLFASGASATLSESLGRPVRIMALGDSITAGCCSPYVGYYNFLADRLAADGYSFATVGSYQNRGQRHEGHGGYWPKDLADGRVDAATGELRGGVAAWMAQSAPDIVLLHAGTNGLSQASVNFDPATASWGSQAADVRRIVDGIFAANPDAFVLMAQIIQTQVPRPDLTAFNQQLASVAATYGNGRLLLVAMEDLLTGDPTAYFGDAIHPNAMGLSLMADAWYDALVPVLDGEVSQVPLPAAGLLLLAGLGFLGGAARQGRGRSRHA